MLMNRRMMLLVMAAACIAVVGTAAMIRAPFGADPALSRFNTLDSASGAAIKGYDPVAYFVDGAARKGSDAFVAEYGGVRWQFASAANKVTFEQQPEKYLPAYGGYCAFGVAQGYLVKIEPDAWSIRDGKLYLNYDAGIQQQWEKDWKAHISKADALFPKLLKKG